MTAEQTGNNSCAKPSLWSIENVRTGRGGPSARSIAKDGKVIARAVNCVTEHNDPTAHAEVEAIRAACKALGVLPH